jgi:hypothetical protein
MRDIRRIMRDIRHNMNVWLQSRSLPARGRVGLEVHRLYKDRVLVPVLMGLLITPISRIMHKS